MPKTISNQMNLYLKGKRDALQQAECYHRGLYVEQDLIVAEELYRQAIRENLPGAHFRLGLFYHHRPGRDAEAAEAYFNAFLEGGLQAKAALEELAITPSAAAYFYLGQVFDRERKRPRALDAYRAAVEAGSVIAIFHLARWYEAEPGHILDALQHYQRAWLSGFEPALSSLEAHAKTNVAAALLLAQGYDGRGDRRALPCYQQANKLGSDQAAFRLGEICERKEFGARANPGQEFEYYLLAAKRGHTTALHVLQRSAESMLNPELEFQLGEIYTNTLKDTIQALAWYKRAADHRHATAYARMQSIAAENMNFAYAAGRSYLSGTNGEKNAERADFFHTLAIRNGHPQAKVDLESSAESGNVEAQYALAEYYHYKNQFKEAALWCMRAADRGHAKAMQYMRVTQFTAPVLTVLAQRYERGEGVAVSQERAMEFYQKAGDLGGSAALLKLGLFCEKKTGDLEGNISAAFSYYVYAASSGCLDALDLLERLAETGTIEMKAGLAQLYRSPEINRPMDALRWEAQIGVAASGTLSYARVAVTTFLRPPAAARQMAMDLSASVNQLSFGVE